MSRFGGYAGISLVGSLIRVVLMIAILTAVYLAASLPFKISLEIIPGFSDVRPVAALQPIYGIFFGIPGCIAFGLGNLLTDILGDSLRASSLAGLVMNAVSPALFCLLWGRLRHGVFDLRAPKDIALFSLLSLLCAAVQSVAISGAVAFSYPEVDAFYFGLTVVGNHTLFPLLLGIPIAILLQEELDVAPRGLGGPFLLVAVPHVPHGR
ncbi:MAG: hypothetical protein U0L71_06340 [Eggerthellaceae bacterium]|nr:hypothetical protein [Eggerthellaceae bacterium]